MSITFADIFCGAGGSSIGLAIINEGEHRFTILDFDIRPDEEGDQ